MAQLSEQEIDLYNIGVENEFKKLKLQMDQQEAHHTQQLADQAIQRLTFFIVGTEVAICGYILLQIKDLYKIPFITLIFFLSGTATLAGLLWRFCLNLSTDGKKSIKEVEKNIPNYLYTIHKVFVISSVLLAIGIIIVGTFYLWHFSPSSKTHNEIQLQVNAPTLQKSNASSSLSHEGTVKASDPLKPGDVLVASPVPSRAPTLPSPVPGSNSAQSQQLQK